MRVFTHGPKPYINKLKELVALLETKGLVSASNKDEIYIT